MKTATSSRDYVISFTLATAKLMVICRGVGSNFDVGRPWVCQVGGETINLINLTHVTKTI